MLIVSLVTLNNIPPIQPSLPNDAVTVAEHEIVLCAGDTTYLDYGGSIVVKRDGCGPIDHGGNGLILHSALAVNSQHGQPLGLLWQKLWNREQKQKPLADKTPQQKKQRQVEVRKRVLILWFDKVRRV